jgi:hypothetical protein
VAALWSGGSALFFDRLRRIRLQKQRWLIVKNNEFADVGSRADQRIRFDSKLRDRAKPTVIPKSHGVVVD